MRTWIVAGIVAAVTAAAGGAQSPQAQADIAKAKLDAIMAASETSANKTAKAPAPRRTVLSQSEMNAYLKYRAQSWLPAGITDPTLQFVGANRIATLVTADLDGVRQKGSGGWFDPTAYLSGRLPVLVTGTLTTGDGKGRFALDTATVDGIPVPRLFIHQLLAYYTRSATNPSGVRMEEPFDLPSEIDRIDVTTGQAIVIQ